ncbi:hypothetical protein TNCV_3665751 [Trichonephila clavipes]|nr:hypothetical protein TNCV_3665751 [Trichonephila clavipes]
MRWRIVGKLEPGECQVQICKFNLTPNVACNFGNSSMILDSSRESLGMVVQEPRQSEKSVICRLSRGVTEWLQLLSSLVTCMQPPEPVYQENLFQKDFMREGCLTEDLLFASRSRLRAGESA